MDLRHEVTPIAGEAGRPAYWVGQVYEDLGGGGRRVKWETPPCKSAALAGSLCRTFLRYYRPAAVVRVDHGTWILPPPGGS